MIDQEFPFEQENLDEGYMNWECDECETCKQVAFHSVHKKKDDIPEKWICVGKIIRPDNPQDLHEAMNQVRFCIADFDTENQSKQWSWTPYEALTVSTVLQFGVRAILNDQHNDEHERLLQNSPTMETPK